MNTALLRTEGFGGFVTFGQLRTGGPRAELPGDGGVTGIGGIMAPARYSAEESRDLAGVGTPGQRARAERQPRARGASEGEKGSRPDAAPAAR